LRGGSPLKQCGFPRFNRDRFRRSFDGVEAAQPYLVELHRPALGWSDLEALTGRARAAAAELRGAGSEVRFLRAVFVPEDGTCFLLFEAESRDAVRRAAAAAGVDLARFVETLH
jgi:hypothetical protein